MRWSQEKKEDDVLEAKPVKVDAEKGSSTPSKQLKPTPAATAPAPEVSATATASEPKRPSYSRGLSMKEPVRKGRRITSKGDPSRFENCQNEQHRSNQVAVGRNFHADKSRRTGRFCPRHRSHGRGNSL